jgi:hypothetical protein
MSPYKGFIPEHWYDIIYPTFCNSGNFFSNLGQRCTLTNENPMLVLFSVFVLWQSVKQKNTGSGDSANFNCGENLIKAGVGENECEFED